MGGRGGDAVGALLISVVVAAFVFLCGYLYGASVGVKVVRPVTLCESAA